MKKIVATMSALMLSLCLLVGCSKLGDVTKALKNADFNVEETVEVTEEDSVMKSITVVKGKTLKDLPIGILVELGSTDELDKAIEELQKDEDYKDFMKTLGTDAKKIHEELEKSGLVNGNMVFFTISKEAIDAFKNA